MYRTFFLIALGSLLLGGCATTINLPEHTLVLGEVAEIVSRDEVLNGLKLGPDDVPPPKTFVQQCGPEEDAIVDGSFVLVRYYYYWQNVPSGAVHQGARWTVVPPGMTLKPGNVVEVELTAGKRNRPYRCATVRRVRFEDLREGRCDYRRDPNTTFDASQTAVNPARGAGAAMLYCPSVEAEGWEPFSMGVNGGAAWRKRPPPSRPGD